MRIAFFGSPSPYYRGIIRNLAELGHRITFHEPGVREDVLDETASADVVVNAGAFDELLEREVIARRRVGQIVIFWDTDAPATLNRMTENPSDPFRSLVSRYDLIFTSGGGDPVVARYRNFGAAQCIPIYNALDPMTHHRVARRPEFEADLSYLGDRLRDREARVDEFFFRAAERLPNARFLLGGSGWDEKVTPQSVSYIGRVLDVDHNAFLCTPRAVLDVSGESTAANGWSPSMRFFEAAGAAACVITDAWEGIEGFLDRGTEVLVAEDGDQVAEIIRDLDPERAAAIGRAALRRVLAQHT